jgi:hypothetical protein
VRHHPRRDHYCGDQRLAGATLAAEFRRREMAHFSLPRRNNFTPLFYLNSPTKSPVKVYFAYFSPPQADCALLARMATANRVPWQPRVGGLKFAEHPDFFVFVRTSKKMSKIKCCCWIDTLLL